LVLLGRGLPAAPIVDARPDWQQSNPAWIEGALRASQKRVCGGWYVLDASRAVGARPLRFEVEGRALVAFRDRDHVIVAPDTCPHLGASLSEGRVEGGCVVCPWHGLRLGEEGFPGWQPLATHDDGVLLWVQLPGETPTEAPTLPVRPLEAVDTVLRVIADCEPRDVIANRLDPWHGTHYHPYAFRRLRVIDQRQDEVTVRVAYRVVGPVAVEVDARFACPDARTITMTIVRGEGEGSVVETHVTPIGGGKTAIVEAVLARSDRRGFFVARAFAPLLRPLVRAASRRLWNDDRAYAERRYTLRLQAGSRRSTVVTISAQGS
jgi:isorenieratene synthase